MFKHRFILEESQPARNNKSLLLENWWPQIGEITQIEKDEVQLLWMTGTYSSKWRVMNIRNKGKRGSSAWEENIKESAIFGNLSTSHQAKNFQERL